MQAIINNMTIVQLRDAAFFKEIWESAATIDDMAYAPSQ